MFLVFNSKYNNFLCICSPIQQATYVELFRQLLNLNPQFSPNAFLIDYEHAVKSAVEQSYSKYYCQGMFLSLVTKYILQRTSRGTTNNVVWWCRFCSADPYAACSGIRSSGQCGWSLWDAATLHGQEALPVLDYFEDIYTGRRTQDQSRRCPQFPISMCNIYAWSCYWGFAWHKQFLGGLAKSSKQTLLLSILTYGTFWKCL